jgi:large subunit ribosomal protein L19
VAGESQHSFCFIKYLDYSWSVKVTSAQKRSLFFCQVEVGKMGQAVDLIQSVEHQSIEQGQGERPELQPGDTVNVHLRIVEGNRERIQVFQGVVIGIKGSDMNKLFTVRRIASHGVGVERTFLYHSPLIEKIEVLRHAKVNRAKLYFLRGRSGKSARLKEKRFS